MIASFTTVRKTERKTVLEMWAEVSLWWLLGIKVVF